MRSIPSRQLLGFAALLALPLTAGAQRARSERWTDECRHSWSDDEDWCERRETTIPARAVLRVDGGDNGGIEVVGWDRSEIRIVALIHTRGEDEADAKELAKEIRINTDGTIRAEGPSSRRRRGWSVSYVISAPRRVDVDLRTENGGVTLEDLSGHLAFSAVNGGIHLSNVQGDVRGETENGGLHIELTGTRWTGEGLDVRTTNGGVHLNVPRDYNANLETGTVNGGMYVGFPIQVQGRIGRTLNTKLGSGGPPVRATTTNGGVEIRTR
jgi:hypothetical protein